MDLKLRNVLSSYKIAIFRELKQISSYVCHDAV